MTTRSPSPEAEDLLPDARFRETHRRLVDAPIENVWAAVKDLRAHEIRLFSPLMELRHLPQRLHHAAQPVQQEPTRPVLDTLVDAGFVMLRDDEEPVDGRCVLILGAVTKFWLPDHSNSVRFDEPGEFVTFAQPGFGRTVFSIEAIARKDMTELVTTTLLTGTDTAANRRLHAYWALIRRPSGLIRRNWLAAIDRRATARGQK